MNKCWVEKNIVLFKKGIIQAIANDSTHLLEINHKGSVIADIENKDNLCRYTGKNKG
jgi:hypothetical protein